jgi:hypothetical protein
VTSLATAIACLCKGFEGPSVVDIHWNARGKCARRGVHCCRGRSGGACEQKNEKNVCGGTGYVISVGAE